MRSSHVDTMLSMEFSFKEQTRATDKQEGQKSGTKRRPRAQRHPCHQSLSNSVRSYQEVPVSRSHGGTAAQTTVAGQFVVRLLKARTAQDKCESQGRSMEERDRHERLRPVQLLLQLVASPCIPGSCMGRYPHRHARRSRKQKGDRHMYPRGYRCPESKLVVV